MSTIAQLDDDYLNHSKEGVELLRNAVKAKTFCKICVAINSFVDVGTELGPIIICKICKCEQDLGE